MRSIIYVIMATAVYLTMGTGCAQAQDKTLDKTIEVPKVYLIKEINSENLIKIYEALGRKAEGNVAVKLSTGEPGGHNFLQPFLIAPLVQKVKGTIVECNTAYGGGRANTEAHLKAAADHGFTAIAKVDIMDAAGEAPFRLNVGSFERRFCRQELSGLRFHGCPFSFQRSCDGRFRRCNQKTLYRYRFLRWQGMDSFCRSGQKT